MVKAVLADKRRAHRTVAVIRIEGVPARTGSVAVPGYIPFQWQVHPALLVERTPHGIDGPLHPGAVVEVASLLRLPPSRILVDKVG